MQTLNLVRGEELLETPGDGPARVVTEAWAGRTSGYVARLGLSTAGGSPLYDLQRTEFLRPLEDRRSRFGNGRRIYEIAERGVYEAESRWHRGQVRRHWLELDESGTLTLLESRDAAIARLLCLARGTDELQELRLAAWDQRPSQRGWQRRVAAAVAANTWAGLPPLEGTAAQVDYAEVIRAERLGERQRAKGIEQRAEGLALNSPLSALRSITEASWWIEHRRTQWRRLVEAAQAWQKAKSGEQRAKSREPNSPPSALRSPLYSQEAE